MERNAITVALKTTSRRFAENLKTLILIQKPNHGVNNVKKDDQTEDVNQISADLESNYSSDEDNCVASVSSADATTPIEAINRPVVFGNSNKGFSGFG